MIVVHVKVVAAIAMTTLSEAKRAVYKPLIHRSMATKVPTPWMHPTATDNPVKSAVVAHGAIAVDGVVAMTVARARTM